MQSYCNILKKKTGQAMFAGIFVMIIISMLAIRFHLMSRDAQTNAHRFQASEVAQQLAESAIDEAFEYVYDATEDKTTTWYTRILDGSLTTASEVPVDQTKEIAKHMGLGSKFDINANVKIKKKFNFSKFYQYGSYHIRKYYGNECVGTLEFNATVKPKDSFKKLIHGSSVITRSHDYKIACIVSRDTSLSQYVQSKCLTYGFFVRCGRDEFIKTRGRSLNPPNTKLTINTNNVGKVYIGGTRNKPVFLNIDKDRSDFIPETLTDMKIIHLDEAKTNNLVPQVKRNIRKKITDRIRKEGASPRGNHCYRGVVGDIFQRACPITDSDITTNAAKLNEMKDVRNAAWQLKMVLKHNAGKPIMFDCTNFAPGIKIEPIKTLSHCLEGQIRKLYFHYGYFLLDTLPGSTCRENWRKSLGLIDKSGVTPYINLNNASIIKSLKKQPLPCYHFDQSLDASYKNMNLKYLNDTILTPQNKNILCDTNYDFPYEKDGKALKLPPQFYNIESSPIDESNTGQYGFLPFGLVNLWSGRKISFSNFANLGLLHGKTLELRGIYQMPTGKPLVIDKPLFIRGQGVLIVDGSITINAKITKSNNKSFLVLVTRGDTITINTKSEIQASLVAIGRGGQYGNYGHIIAQKPMHLKGAFVVDKLYIDKWCPGNHTIEYDSNLCGSADQYQINLSRWVTFLRMVEKE